MQQIKSHLQGVHGEEIVSVKTASAGVSEKHVFMLRCRRTLRKGLSPAPTSTFIGSLEVGGWGVQDLGVSSPEIKEGPGVILFRN